MAADDMSVETMELPVTSSATGGIENQTPLERPILDPEFQEWLKPSETIHNHTALELFHTGHYLRKMSEKYETPMTLDQVPDVEFAKLLKDRDFAWAMGVLAKSPKSREISMKYRKNDDLDSILPGLADDDIVASPFAVYDYTPDPTVVPSWEAWDEKVVERLHGMGKKVFLDFIPNHMAVDSPWVREHPEWFVQGKKELYEAGNTLYFPVDAADGNTYYIAHGKDPYNPQWEDTAQLNYANPAVQEKMEQVLMELAEHADGVRCDMAALPGPDRFLETWGDPNSPIGDHLSPEENTYISQNDFWGKVIPRVKEHARELGKDDFTFVAEAYWDIEKLEKSFDFIYSKEFYDHLRRVIVDGEPAGENLKKHINYLIEHGRKVLFTQNHDEPPAVSVFGREGAKIAAAITGCLPYSIFLTHFGQEQGNEIRTPMQLGRVPYEEPKQDMIELFDRLPELKNTKLFQHGDWEEVDLDTQNENIFALKVSLGPNTETDGPKPDHEIGAVICFNPGDFQAGGKITDIGVTDRVQVMKLIDGGFVLNPDMNRDGGMYMEIRPNDAQVVFYSREAQNQEIPQAA